MAIFKRAAAAGPTIDEAGLYHDARSLLESRAAPLGGVLLVAMLGLLGAGIGWSAWAKVDEVVLAGGRVEPRGKVKLINHPRGGVVSEVLVEEGERVEAGAPLVRLDPDLRQGEYAELRGRFEVRAVEAARLTAEAQGGVLRVSAALAAARPDLLTAETELMAARAEALTGRRDVLSKAVATRRNEARSAAADLARLKSSIVLQRQQIEAFRELADRALYPRLKLGEAERQLVEIQGEAAKAEAAFAAATSAQAESEARLSAVDRDWRSEVLDALGKATAERDRLAEQFQAQEQLLGTMLVRAPVAGIVQDLKIAGPGQAIAANEPILRLVPIYEGLVVEARVANADIGRIANGLPATLKIKTYDFLRHGTLAGHVVKVGADATPEQRTGELSYIVTVATDRSRLGVEPGELELGPGMLVDVELKVGERTILSFLTDRIIRLKNEAFRQG